MGAVVAVSYLDSALHAGSGSRIVAAREFDPIPQPDADRGAVVGLARFDHPGFGIAARLRETIFKIVDADSVYVFAVVPEAEPPQIRNLSGAELEVPGLPQPRPLSRLASVGRVVDPQSRTFPVIHQVET